VLPKTPWLQYKLLQLLAQLLLLATTACQCCCMAPLLSCLIGTAQQPHTFSSMRAATGKQLKQSVKVLHSLMLYRRLHSS
jgi:hypothetical protein